MSEQGSGFRERKSLQVLASLALWTVQGDPTTMSRLKREYDERLKKAKNTHRFVAG